MIDTKQVEVQHEKETFRDKISDIFEEMWEKIGQRHYGIAGRAAKGVAAETDLSEAENVLNYSLELPGMDENDVEVAIEAGRLAIRGEKRDEREETGANYVFKERSFGSFERIFTLPANAEEEGVEASFNKGVLTVTIPCKAGGEGGTRKIEVTAG